MADGLDVILNDAQVKSVFVNVFGGITSCDAVANGIVGALDILGDEATKPLVVRLDGNNVEEGRRILDEAQPPAGDARRHDGRCGRQGRRARERVRTGRDMSIYLNKDSKVIVQGITGGEGTKHTALMLKAGTNVVGGVNARKAGTTVEHTDADGNAVELPVFGTVKEAMAETGADVSVVFVPPAFTKDAVRRGHRRRHRPARDHHRGRARAGHRRGVGLPQASKQEHPDDRAELPRHHHARARRCAGITPADDLRQGPGRPGVEVGHADLPDDVRAARLRLLHRDRHRRRPDHRDHPHRRARRRSRPTPTPRRS